MSPTSLAIAALVGCFVVVVVGAIMVTRSLHQARVGLWKKFALQRELDYREGGPQRLGELTGTLRGRALRLVAVSKQESRFGRVSTPGALAELVLRPEMKSLHFRRENPLDRVPLIGPSEVQIGDEELDPLLLLMGTDAHRYRQLLLQPEVRKRVLRAFESNGVLIVEKGTLTLARPGQDLSDLGRVLDEALDLAEALEHGDGIGWRMTAMAFDLKLEQDESKWTLSSEEGMVEVRYDPGVRGPIRSCKPSSRARIRLDERLKTLRISRRDLELPGLRTGDPILDAHIHVSGVYEDRVCEWCAIEGFTEGVLNLVKGLDGVVEDGFVVSEQDGLMAEPGDVIADMLALVEILEKPLPELSEGA